MAKTYVEMDWLWDSENDRIYAVPVKVVDDDDFDDDDDDDNDNELADFMDSAGH